MHTENIPDRRKHQRFKAREGLFAGLEPSGAVGEITDISEGDDIWGVMYRSSNVWYVYFINQTTVETSWIASYNHPDADDLVFQVVLEGPNVLDDDDVCGDIEFHDMVFKDDSNDDIEGIELIPNINPYYDIRLSNLDVDCDQSAPIDNSWATLYTDN